eukprot:g66247.t1
MTVFDCRMTIGSNLTYDGDGSDLTYCKQGCGGNFHENCLKMWRSQKGKDAQCPLCRAPLSGKSQSSSATAPHTTSGGYANFAGCVCLCGGGGGMASRNTSDAATGQDAEGGEWREYYMNRSPAFASACHLPEVAFAQLAHSNATFSPRRSPTHSVAVDS